MRWLLRAGFALFVACALAVLAFLFLPAIGSVSAKALSYSLTRKVDGSLLGVAPCRRPRRGPAHRYRCLAPDSSGSGGTVYVVTVHGRCWTARLAYAGRDARRRRVKGCVEWRDQLRLGDRLL